MLFKKSSEKKINSVLVLGSTSEVAESICIELAKQGSRNFHLICRDLKKNNKLFNLLSNYGVNVTQEQNDLLDNTSLKKLFNPKLEFFDLYIILSGYLGDNIKATNDVSEALKITSSNFTGLIPWINAIVTNKRICKPGKLWVFSSVAGDRGRPSNYYYGASKSALTTLGEGLIARCHNKPFQIRIIKAGFIYTSLTIGKAPKILCISPKFLAKQLLKNSNKRGIEYLPSWWFIIMFLVKRLPVKFISKL